MRLKPPVTEQEALSALSAAAVLSWGAEEAGKLEAHLQSIAEAMAIVGALDIPDAVEPIFGEDISTDPEVL